MLGAGRQGCAHRGEETRRERDEHVNNLMEGGREGAHHRAHFEHRHTSRTAPDTFGGDGHSSVPVCVVEERPKLRMESETYLDVHRR